MTPQERFPKSEYEAQIIKVLPHDNYSFENGGKIIYHLDNNELVAYHITGINNTPTDISLKLAGYYVNYPYYYGERYYHKRMVKRHCIVVLELQKKKNRLVPVIVNFKFSYIDLFHYNGESDGSKR